MCTKTDCFGENFSVSEHSTAMKSIIATLFLVLALSAVQAQEAPPITVSVYYESLCPFSKDFIVNQLWPTYLLLPDIVIVEFYPYGNAETTVNGDSYNFTCQHGPEECVGNIIQACALNYYPDNPHSVPFIGCDMANDPVVSAEQCAADNGMDYNEIMTCANGDLGIQLEYQCGVTTESLDPPQTGTPWINIDGIHNDYFQNMAENDLLRLICTLYLGPTPEPCVTTTVPPPNIGSN